MLAGGVALGVDAGTVGAAGLPVAVCDGVGAAVAEAVGVGVGARIGRGVESADAVGRGLGGGDAAGVATARVTTASARAAPSEAAYRNSSRPAKPAAG
jgi:hypothetical protein